MKKPNIIFVMTDQMRATAMGCSGIEKVYTQNLDEFASQGTRFTRAISNTPACSPARASVLTGLHTISHKVVNNDKPIDVNLKTIAKCLNEVGYKCGYIGKWHLDCADRGMFIPPGPRRMGFDDFWAGVNCNHDYMNAYYYCNDDPNPIWIDGYEPIVQTDIAIDYINNKSQQKSDPFMLFLSYGPPHCPYLEVTEKYKDIYPANTIELKPNAVQEADKEQIAGYYAHITALDECFGRLMKCIDENDIGKDTIVIFTSDHGDMLFSQNRGWKSKPWSESVNVPFIIRWPEHVPAGKVSNGLISLVDLMPTILSLCSVEIPKAVQGVDLSKMVLGEAENTQSSVFINFYVVPDFFSYKEWRGIVTERYTYARFNDKPWILYDDIDDIHQLQNLVDDVNYREILECLDNEMKQWLTVLDDHFETSLEVADKYYEGHIGGVIPCYENDVIVKGKGERNQKQR